MEITPSTPDPPPGVTLRDRVARWPLNSISSPSSSRTTTSITGSGSGIYTTSRDMTASTTGIGASRVLDVTAAVHRRLLVAPTGQPLHASTGGYRWRRACEIGGVVGVRLHDLRHFYASGLIAQGIDVVAVQRALGHQSAEVTPDTCSHLWPSAEDRTRAAALELLASVSEVRLQDHADSLRTKGYE